MRYSTTSSSEACLRAQSPSVTTATYCSKDLSRDCLTNVSLHFLGHVIQHDACINVEAGPIIRGV